MYLRPYHIALTMRPFHAVPNRLGGNFTDTCMSASLFVVKLKKPIDGHISSIELFLVVPNNQKRGKYARYFIRSSTKLFLSGLKMYNSRETCCIFSVRRWNEFWVKSELSVGLYTLGKSLLQSQKGTSIFYTLTLMYSVHLIRIAPPRGNKNIWKNSKNLWIS